jgi:hypothetical protein
LAFYSACTRLETFRPITMCCTDIRALISKLYRLVMWCSWHGRATDHILPAKPADEYGPAVGIGTDRHQLLLDIVLNDGYVYVGIFKELYLLTSSSSAH